MGAAAENEIVVPSCPSTLGPATGDAQETLGLSTVRTLSGSPWLASASPVTLSPARTTAATTSRRALFRFPRRTCLAMIPTFAHAATCRSPLHLQDKQDQPPPPPSGKRRRTMQAKVVVWPWRLLTGRFEAVELSRGSDLRG